MGSVQDLFAHRRYGSSEIVQQRLARSTIVKTFTNEPSRPRPHRAHIQNMRPT
jgi:hypothetical protein